MKHSHTCNRRDALAMLGACAAAGTWSSASAQAFPTRPLELVVPYPAGGSTDAVARLLAGKIAPLLGQPVVIDNRAGASGNIGAAHVARATGDGHRLLMAANAVVTINPHLFKNPGFDPFKDLVPVSLICSGALAIAVNAQSNIRTLQDLIAATRRDPKGSFYATPSAGTPQHLMGELFAQAAGIQLTPVHYKGVAPAMADVLGGTVPILISTYATLKPQLDAGKLRILAIGESQRIAIAPQVPTIAETYPGFEMNIWFGIFAPAGTPPAAREKLEGAFVQAMAAQDSMDLLNSLALPPIGGPGARLAQALRRDHDTFGTLIRAKNISAE